MGKLIHNLVIVCRNCGTKNVFIRVVGPLRCIDCGLPIVERNDDAVSEAEDSD